MPPQIRGHLCVVTAETAWLAGWLSRQLDNHGDTAGYWALLGTWPVRRATARSKHVLVAASSLYSPVTGRSGGDTRTALGLLDQAEAAAGGRRSPALQSWIVARRGEEHAAVGHVAAAAGHCRAYDRSRALIELAEAYVTRRDIDHACAVLDDCLTLTNEVGLVSHRQRVRRVRQRLEPWRDTSAVRSLDERLMPHV